MKLDTSLHAVAMLKMYGHIYISMMWCQVHYLRHPESA
jgi:hypothetical protein